MADYKTPQWLLPNEKNLAYPAAGAETGSGLSEDRHSLYSMDFDGTQYIDCGTSSELKPKLVSCSVWIKGSSSSNPQYTRIVSQDGPTAGADAYGFYVTSTNKVVFAIKTSVTGTVTSSLSSVVLDDNWHNIVGTYDGSNVNIYVDGSVVGSPVSGTGDLTYGSGGFTIGCMSEPTALPSQEFTGQIDEVAIWNKALSATEVAALSTASAPANVMALSAKPIAYYPLGEQAQMGSANWSFPNGSLQSHAINFDGSTDSIGIPETIYSGAFTFSFWLKPDNLTLAFIAGDINSNSNFIWLQSSTIIMLKASGSYYSFTESAGNDITIGSWQNITITRDSSNNVKAFRNGVAFGGTSVLSGDFKLNSIGQVFSAIGNWLFNGLMSNIAIWNSDQSTNKDNIYNNGSPQSTYTATPTAWWKLNAANSSYDTATSTWTFIDTETPAPNYTSALNFDGLNDYIDLGGDSSLFPTTAITVSIWLKASTQGNFKYILAAPNTASYPAYGFQVKTSGASQYVQFVLNTGTAIISPFADVLDNNWHHIAATYNGSILKMFVDGSEVGTGTSTSGSIIYGPGAGTGAGKLLMGDFGVSSLFFTGSLSNCSIYSSALSAAQVQTLYNSGTPETAISSSPISWWKLDNTTTGIQDSGSASNNGTNNGATQIATNVLISNNGESDTLPTSALIPSDLQFESPYSNYSLSFDGTSNFIDCGNIPALQNASVITWNLWVNFNSANYNIVFGKDLVGTTDVIQFYTWASGVGYFFLKTAGTSVTASISSFIGGLVNTGDWNMFTIVFDGSETGDDRLKIYLNGGVSNIITSYSGTVPATLPNTTDEFYIGKGLNGDFDGKMDEFSIFNKVLNQAEKTSIYNNGYPNDLTSLSPSQWWRLGEDAYFVGNDITIPNQITGGQTGTGSGTQTAILVGDAPGSYANGSGTNLAVEDRIGDAPESTANSVSINMIPSNRISYPAGYVPTQVDNAFSMEFDGTSTKISFSDITLASSYTLSAWAKRTNSSNNEFLFGNGATYGYGAYFNGTTAIYFKQDSGNTTFNNAAITTALSRTDWVNWMFVKDSTAGTISIYVDGALAQSVTSALGMTSINTIGGDGTAATSYIWTGNIDEVAIFDYALSERQIKQDIYEGTTTGKTADLNNISNLTAPVAWYRMGD